MDIRENLVINDYIKYNGFLKELKEKNCYSDNILTIIQVVLPSIVQHYGQEYEDIILDTLRTTKIIQAKNNETIYDVLKKNENENNQIIGDEMVKEGELKRASGV